MTHMVSERPSVVVRGAGRYEALLLLLVMVLVLAPFESTVLEPVIVALLSGVLVFAMWTSSAPSFVVWLGAGLALACVVTSAVAPVWTASSKGAFALVSIILSLAAIVSIVTHLTQRRTTTLTTLSGAVAIYLLVGLSFADLYMFLAQLAGTPFFAQPGPHGSVAYVYFSFTTLTTVGFGDLSAGTDPGRMLAVMEALLGQLYLVTVVAFIVASHRRERT
jgi:Ion channel